MRMQLLPVILALSGCATMRSVDVGDESSVQEALEEGDRITLITTDNQQLQLTVLSLTDDEINGEDQNGRSVSIAYEDVMQLEVREQRPGRTAALVGGSIGGLVLLYAIATAALVGALAAGI